MKFFAILTLCLALLASPCRGNPLIFDAINSGIEAAGTIAGGLIDGAGQVASNAANIANNIAQGVITAGTSVGKGVVAAGEAGLTTLNSIAGGAAKAIAQTVDSIRSTVLKATIKRVQETIQNISDGSQALLAAAEQAGKKVKEHILNVEDKLDEKLQNWADKAKEKLDGADDETRQAGEKLIDELTTQRTEELNQCTDKILGELESLQEKANATAKKYVAPTQELIAEIGKCSDTSAARCARSVAEKLKPLLSAPGDLAALKLKVDKAALTNIQRNVCIAGVLTRFEIDSRRVEKNIDILMKDQTTTASTTAEETTTEEEVSSTTADAADDTDGADAADGSDDNNTDN